MYEPPQHHVIIDLPICQTHCIIDEFIELYEKGLSIRDIAKQTGKPKSTVQKKLTQAGIELRPKVTLPTGAARREKRNGGARPYFGFCFFQGRVVPDPREYPTLLRIHALWKAGRKPMSITNDLNSKKMLARGGSTWLRGSVGRIIERFENAKITIKGDKYELR